MIDLDAPPKKPLALAIREGRAYWRRQLKLRIEATQRALDAGDDAAAANYLRRAKVCERALRRWDDIEAAAKRGAAR